MKKRLPQPAKMTRPRCIMDQSEMEPVENAAHLAKLSVTSWIRVALIDAAAHPERLAAWQEIAARLNEGTGAEPPKRPGRPKGPKK